MAESDVIRVLNEYRQALEAKEEALMREMTLQWLKIEQKLDADIALLARRMDDLRTEGKTVTEQMVWREQRYKILRAQMEEQIKLFNQEYAAKAVEIAQEQYALLGIDAAQNAILTQFGPMGTYFNRININAVQSMIGFAGDGSPLYKLLANAYPDAVDGLLQALINGMARGLGPAQIAKDMTNGMGMGLERALLIARTESLRAYRTASTQQYRDSGVCTGFMRLVKKTTACMACLALDGQIFESADELTDHPRGKCTAIPIVEGVSAPKWQKGKAWFNTLPAEQQRAIMGPAKYEAFKDGRIKWDDLSRMVHDDTWGDSPRVATLKELGL